MGSTDNFVANYEICDYEIGELTIEKTALMSDQCTIIFDESITTATIKLPNSPPSEFMGIRITDSNAEWDILGYTRTLEIRGDLVGSDFKVISLGTELDSQLEVLFGDTPCPPSGYNVVLDESMISINNQEIAQFGNGTKEITFTMNKCNDTVQIKKTFANSNAVRIVATSGNNTIVIGDESKPFEEQIHCNVDIVGGNGMHDLVQIFDSASTLLKPSVEMRPTKITGLHKNTTKEITFSRIEMFDIRLGTVAANFTVFATANNTGTNLFFS